MLFRDTSGLVLSVVRLALDRTNTCAAIVLFTTWRVSSCDLFRANFEVRVLVSAFTKRP